MQLKEILQGIAHAQDMQNREGAQHPGCCFAFTFPVTPGQHWVLSAKGIQGLEFVEMRDPSTQIIRLMGCFKPRKADGNASHQSVHP